VTGDVGLVVAALVGLALTAGAILRDTRHRADVLRITPTSWRAEHWPARR